MNEHKPENDCGLIVEPAVLAGIRTQCQRRRAELEAAGALPPLSIAPGRPQAAFEELPAPALISESERFAVAVSEMPPKVRAFFEREESPYIPPHRRESDQAREEREERTSFGGWCGG